MRKTVAAATLIAGEDLAGIIAAEVAPLVGRPATLIKRVPTARASDNLAGGTRAVATSYACTGTRKESGNPDARVVTVSLFGATILDGADRIVPEPGDSITIGGETRAIVAVDGGNAAAAYRCTMGGPGPGMR
jgi:hypothetical protein